MSKDNGKDKKENPHHPANHSKKSVSSLLYLSRLRRITDERLRYLRQHVHSDEKHSLRGSHGKVSRFFCSSSRGLETDECCILSDPRYLLEFDSLSHHSSQGGLDQLAKRPISRPSPLRLLITTSSILFILCMSTAPQCTYHRASSSA